MSEALDKAHATRAAMKQAGILPNKTVKFSGSDKVLVGEVSYTETELIKLAASRAGAGGMTSYVRDLVFAQAKIDAAKPVRERSTRSVEDLLKEKAALEARIAKMSAPV